MELWWKMMPPFPKLRKCIWNLQQQQAICTHTYALLLHLLINTQSTWAFSSHICALNSGKCGKKFLSKTTERMDCRRRAEGVKRQREREEYGMQISAHICVIYVCNLLTKKRVCRDFDPDKLERERKSNATTFMHSRETSIDKPCEQSGSREANREKKMNKFNYNLYIMKLIMVLQHKHDAQIKFCNAQFRSCDSKKLYLIWRRRHFVSRRLNFFFCVRVLINVVDVSKICVMC